MAKRFFSFLTFLKKQRFWIVVALTISTWFSLYPSLPANFLNWDDDQYVTGNQYIQKLNPEGLKNIFTVEIVGNYHPLTLLSLALDLKVQGMSPIPFHFTNLIIHTLCVFLTFLFIERISKGKLWVAFFVALIFAIHPAHVESVAWISARKDPLFLVFYLWGLLQYLNYIEFRNWKYFAYAMICFGLSLLSKPTAVTFPLALLLLDFLSRRDDYKKLLLEKIVPLAIAGGFGLIVIQYQGNAIGKVSGDYYTRFAIACFNILDYIGLLFWPVNLSTSYPYTFSYDSVPMYILLAPIAVFFLLALAVLFVKKTRIPLFSLLFFIGTIILTLQYVPVGWQIKADRYTYLPFIGLLFGLGMGIDFAFRKIYPENSFRKFALIVLTLSIGLPFMVMSNLRSRIWQNSELLWTDAIEKYPINPLAYYNRGCQYLESGNQLLALRDFGISQGIDGMDYNVQYNLSYSFYKLGLFDNAIKESQKAIEQDSTRHEGYNVKGISYMAVDSTEQALWNFKKTLEISPDFYNGYFNMGVLYHKLGNWEMAIQNYEKAIQIAPLFGPAHHSRALALREQGKTEEAKESIEKAIKMGVRFDPHVLEIFYE